MFVSATRNGILASKSPTAEISWQRAVNVPLVILSPALWLRLCRSVLLHLSFFPIRDELVVAMLLRGAGW
jgi:hypothetical protein